VPRRIRLQAHHRLGVPVHDAPSDRGRLRRVPDGTEATVLGEVGKNWLELALTDGTTGFVTRRYAPDLGRPPPTPRKREGAGHDLCAHARERGTSPTEPGEVRIATFNVRWFPDGMPGKKAAPGGGTDLELLACSIAATGAAVVLVQEFKTSARAQASLRTVLGALVRLNGGDWQARFDDCPNETAQHVGFLFDQKRAQPLGPVRTLGRLNPLGSACAGSLRPGLAQRFHFAGGREAELVSVHLKSGSDARSYGLRRQSLDVLPELAQVAPGELRIIGGDLNTMGCDECPQPSTAAAERRVTAEGALESGFALVDPASGCSHYYRGQPTLLDGFLVAGSAIGVRAEMGGACAELACAKIQDDAELGQHDRVSDHCPLVLSLPAP